MLQRTHVVQTIGEFQQDDSDIVNHGQKQFAVIFGLPLLLGGKLYLTDLGNTVNEVGDIFSEVLTDRAEVEALLQLFAQRHPDIAVTVLRPCWVVGPTIETGLTRYFDPGTVTILLGYDPLLQFLHEEDLLSGAWKALVSDVRGPINLAPSGVVPLSTLLRVAGKRPRSVPHPLLYQFGSLAWLSSTGDPPSAFYDFLRFSWTIDGTHARDSLGFEPLYTTKEAWMSFVVSRRLRRYR